MTLKKADIIEELQEQTGYPKQKCSETVEAMLEIMKKTMEDGDDILISGFGKFSVKEKKERRGRNPATGEDMMLPARKVVTFRSSENLKERVNRK